MRTGTMKREAGGQGEFSVGRNFGAATPPGARQDFWRINAPPPGALVHVKKVTVLNVFCALSPSMP